MPKLDEFMQGEEIPEYIKEASEETPEFEDFESLADFFADGVDNLIERKVKYRTSKNGLSTLKGGKTNLLRALKPYLGSDACRILYTSLTGKSTKESGGEDDVVDPSPALAFENNEQICFFFIGQLNELWKRQNYSASARASSFSSIAEQFQTASDKRIVTGDLSRYIARAAGEMARQIQEEDA